MIRRRPQNSLSETTDSANGSKTESASNGATRRSPDQSACHRFLSSKLLQAATLAACIIVLFETANYLDSVYTINTSYKPNNMIDGTERNIIGAANKNDHGAKVAGTTDSRVRALSISDIPDVRHEAGAFKAIKARFDYATSIGQSENRNNFNNTSGQYLLAFGIIGFPKCGTTTMSKLPVSVSSAFY